jgi:hypothetical protein
VAGRFILNSIPPGVVKLCARHEDRGQCTREVSVEPGVEFECNMTLGSVVAFEGRVVDQTGQAVAGQQVTVLVQDGDTTKMLWQGMGLSDANGELKIAGVPAGSLVHVVVHREVEERVHLTDVDPKAGRCEIRIKRLPAKTSRLRMVVVDEQGAAVDDARMQFRRLGSAEGAVEVKCAGGGRLVSDLLVPGEYRLAVLAYGRIPYEAVVNIAGGADYDCGVVTLRLGGR